MSLLFQSQLDGRPLSSWTDPALHVCMVAGVWERLWKHSIRWWIFRLLRQRVPLSIVALLFISSSLLWLVLCQEVTSIIGCCTQGHDPADGSIVCLDTTFLHLIYPKQDSYLFSWKTAKLFQTRIEKVRLLCVCHKFLVNFSIYILKTSRVHMLIKI